MGLLTHSNISAISSSLRSLKLAIIEKGRGVMFDIQEQKVPKAGARGQLLSQEMHRQSY